MGSALATTLIDNGYRVTVWNRTPGRADPLRDHGAVVANTVRQAVEAGGPVIVCLFDYSSVHQTLDLVAEILRGRSVINLTTTTPAEAREVAA